MEQEEAKLLADNRDVRFIHCDVRHLHADSLLLH